MPAKAILPAPLLSLALAASVHAGEFGNRHVLLFGIDGLRSDALKLSVGKGEAPNISNLIQSGTVTWTAYTGGPASDGNIGQPAGPDQQATVSGPGWSTVFTGVWADKHGVTDNSFKGKDFTRYPTLFDRLHESHPRARFVSLLSWPPIHEHIITPSPEKEGLVPMVRHTWPHDNPAEVEKTLIATTLREVSAPEAPDVVFCYQAVTDTAGHGHGFSPDVTEYMAAIHMADARLGEVLATVRARPSFAGENWLFIVATDHGGSGTKHGGQSPEERVIPLIVSGGDVPGGSVSNKPVPQTCIPATVLHHLGVSIPAAWSIETSPFPASP